MNNLSQPPIDVKERLRIFTPLGIRFWDTARDSAVRDGLTVTARRKGTAGPVRQAFRTGGGLYAFRRLPGLRPVEYPDPDATDPESLAGPFKYIIEVRDEHHRFLPVVFAVDVPLSSRGIYPAAAAVSLPEDGPAGFYLFSAPARTPAPGIAAVRAQIRDVTSGQPAAYAVLEVVLDGSAWYGIADDQGRVAVQFPYPRVEAPLFGSPPAGSQPLANQQWALEVRVRYQPDGLTSFPPTTVPDYRSIFEQEQGLLYEHSPDASPPGGLTGSLSVSLHYGEPAIVRTGGVSELLVQPNVSIP